MTEGKPHTLRVELPEGSIEAQGTEEFLARVRSALALVISGHQIGTLSAQPAPGGAPQEPPIPRIPEPRVPERLPTIRDLYTEKRPASDTQTAALIAYYLSEVAPREERSDTV